MPQDPHSPPRIVVDDGPPHPPSSAARAGLVEGPVVRRVDLGRAAVLPLGEGATVRPGQRLRIAVYPDLDGHDGFAATGVWPLALADDAAHTLTDQHGHDRPGAVPCLVVQQWNVLDVDLDRWPDRSVDLALDCPTGPGRLWLQVVGAVEPPGSVTDPVEAVSTTRGSHSGRAFSRGNTFPATCLPHGFNFLTPVTDARTRMWLYRWHGEHSATPRLQALAVSHQPSPWIKERTAVHLMGWQGRPEPSPRARALAFNHDDETDRPHHYRVALADGSVAEMVPTDHAALFRFSWPDSGRERGVLIDIPGAGVLRHRLLSDGRAEVWGRLSAPVAGNHQHRAPAGFFFARTRQRVTRAATGSRRLRCLALRLAAGESLDVELATSFISVDQARRNLALEAEGVGFDELRARAHDAWAELLGRLEVPHQDPADAQLARTALTCLYRVHCWPNSMHENAGSDQNAEWVHACPFSKAPLPRPWRPGALWRTTSPIVEGRIQVNNGYWDTYRAAWPHLTLFTPELAGDLADGLLAGFRECGWMGRWTAPGHVDSMVGTSSDVVLADAARHGLAFDELTAYSSALRNASCPSPDPHTGRKGIGIARFLGWVPAEIDESVSWSVENAVCDAALATWSADLARRADQLGIPEQADQLRANARWLTNRSLGLGQLFDPATGMLRARRRDGSWADDHFDPLDWGGPYTETNAWGSSVSMTHDGAGLAALHGGREQLAAHLDRLLATPETGRHPGSYPASMHEITEAQALRMGQLALSNQPAHHIAWMYLHAGRPDCAHAVVRELLERGFVGSEIGQGYPGDEDNGEMSAWWLFAAMGLFPLSPGSGAYLLGAPLASMALRRDEGRLAVVVHSEGTHVAAVRRNGASWPHTSITVEELRGEVTLDVELSPTPTRWGRDGASRDPWSLSTSELGRDWGAWHANRAGAARWRPSSPALLDQSGEQVISVDGPLEARWPTAWQASLVVLTFDEPGEVDLRVEASDADQWREVSVRTLRADWPSQSIPVALDGLALNALRLWLPRRAKLRQVEVY